MLIYAWVCLRVYSILTQGREEQHTAVFFVMVIFNMTK